MKSSPCLPGLFAEPFTPLPKPHEVAYVDEQSRRENNKQRVLERLKKGPADGNELDAIAGRRFGARIHQLKEDGWDIVSEPLTRNLYRYTLKGRKAVQEHL